MPAHVQDQGLYEVFETAAHRLLVLDGRQGFTWTRGPQGDQLARTEVQRPEQPAAWKGTYYLVVFEQDPKYENMLHLFLERDGRYQALQLPEGLPAEAGRPKPAAMTAETLSRDRLESRLEEATAAERGERSAPPPDSDAVAIVAHYLEGITFPASRAEVLRYARSNEAPEAVLEQLEKLEEGPFSSMTEVTSALH